MTIRHCAITQELRFFESDNPADWAEFDAFCILQHWRPGLACLRGLHGQLSRKLLRQLAATLLDQGITIIYADRAPHRKLPIATKIDSGDFAGMWRLDLKAIPDAAT